MLFASPAVDTATAVSKYNNQVHSNLLELMKQTGYTFQQKNGQRILGPPNNWRGSPPQRGCEVFLAKLPRYVFENELFPLFSAVGNIYQMRLMVDFSGYNRGFGFVQFSNLDEARTAVVMLNNYEIRPGKFIGVIKSIDNRRVYVGNLPKELTKAQLTSFFEREVEGIVDVIVYQSVVKKPLNRGFVFLEFSSHTDAAIARRKLKHISMEAGKQIIVDWATPLPEIPDLIMNEVKILYLRNLLLSTSEATIFQAMGSVSGKEVVKVKKINDFAFVHFMTRQSAEAALLFWNNKPLDGSIIEVTWAKPPQKAHEKRKLTSFSGVVQTPAPPCDILQTPPPPMCNERAILSPVVRSSEGECFACKYQNVYSQPCSFYDGTNNNNNYYRSLPTSIPGNQQQNFNAQIPWPQSRNVSFPVENFGDVNCKQSTFLGYNV